MVARCLCGVSVLGVFVKFVELLRMYCSAERGRWCSVVCEEGKRGEVEGDACEPMCGVKCVTGGTCSVSVGGCNGLRVVAL